MKKKMHDLISLCLGSFLLLILFFPLPCMAQDGFTGFRLLVSPLPGSLAGLPMEISFNGSARDKRQMEPPGRIPGEVSGPVLFQETSSLSGTDRPFARFQDYMLKYVTITTPVSGEEMFENTATGVEGKSSEKISLEVQAGLAELSGALFIVLQL